MNAFVLLLFLYSSRLYLCVYVCFILFVGLRASSMALTQSWVYLLYILKNITHKITRNTQNLFGCKYIHSFCQINVCASSFAVTQFNFHNFNCPLPCIMYAWPFSHSRCASSSHTSSHIHLRILPAQAGRRRGNADLRSWSHAQRRRAYRRPGNLDGRAWGD